eukprot:scaffold2098_cov270-Chaetoceros_neogracile.AAC.32
MQDRNYWVQLAKESLERARQGTRNLKNGKNKRLTLKSNLIEKSTHLHIEDDLGLYLKAAEASLICGKWRQASETFAKAASMYRHELKDTLVEAATLYCEAAWCREKIKRGDGREFFEKAISIYTDDEQYDQAARIRKWIARNEEKNENHREAIIQYKMTCQYYKAAKMNEQVMYCKKRIGLLLASIGDYDEASNVYYEIGKKELEHNLLKYGVQHTFFRSSLLLLAKEEGDLEKVKNRIQEARNADFRFEISPGCEFMLHIVKSIEMEKVHDFADHLYDFNELYPFDELNLILLNKITKKYFVNVNVNVY